MTKSALIDRKETPAVVSRAARQAEGSVHKSGYMTRMLQRRERAELKNNVIFGLTFGWVLTLIGAFKSWILLEGGVAPALLIVGLVFLVTTLTAPGLMVYPHRIMKGIATFVGTYLFKGVLSVVYFLTILPAGLVYQKKNNQEPFYSWTDKKPARIEGWVDKIASDENGSTTQYVMPSWLQPLQVVIYFAKHSTLLFLPCLIVLIMLGLIGIFVQSSALAPFIYTLF